MAKNALLHKTLLHFSNTERGQKGIHFIRLFLRLKIDVFKAIPFLGTIDYYFNIIWIGN
jgi:hypothetical protein